jgi:hypothetical protein
MTCTTFLHDNELNVSLPNAECQKILDEVRNKTGENWQVVELKFTTASSWFDRVLGKKKPPLYGLYVYVGGMGPWQQINFFRIDSKTSINLYVPLELIVAYLIGKL